MWYIILFNIMNVNNRDDWNVAPMFSLMLIIWVQFKLKQLANVVKCKYRVHTIDFCLLVQKAIDKEEVLG